MSVNRFGRRMASVAGAAAGAVVLALLPQTAAQAVDDVIAVSGITTGQYVAAGSTIPLTITASTADTAQSIEVFVDGAPQPSLPCDPVGPTCEVPFSLDTTGMSVGSHSVVAELTTDIGPQAASDSVTFRVGDEPTALILSPAGGSTFVGSVDVSVRGTTDPAGADYPASFELLVDGAPLVGATAEACPGADVGTFLNSCTRTITASIVSLSAGPVRVRVTTQDGVVRTSDPITLNQATAPTVSISSPADNATNVLPSANGIVSFQVSGNADAGLGSVGKKLELFIDGGATAEDTLTCAASTNACAGTLRWDSTGVVSAAHTADVRITVLGVTRTASVDFSLADQPSVTVQDPGAGLSGATSITVRAQTDPDTVEKPSSVVLKAVNASDPEKVFPSVDCDAAPVNGACTFTVPWDVSALSGSYNLRAVLTTTTGRTRTSPVTGVVIANAGPVITVTAPSATVVKGRVTVSASARVGTSITGHITSLTLFADGAQVGKTKTCTAATTLCTSSATWDTTLLPNASNVQIAARVTTSTTGGKVFNSTARIVRLANPKPTAVFLSPKASSVVSGSDVTITVGLKTDPTQSDVPAGAAIYRNGASTPFDTYACTKGTHSCFATFTWNASRAAGPSSFVVKVRTSKNRTVLSSARTLYAASAARIVFDATTTVDNGTQVRLSGRLLAVRTGLPLAGRAVAIVRDPALGSTSRGTVTTSSTGRFSVTFTAASNTRITATSVAVRSPLGAIYIAPATASKAQTVRAPMTCSVSSSVVSAGQRGTGTCRVPGLPVGTPLFLRYYFGGAWSTLATGASSSTTIPFAYQFPKRGFYQLRVILSGSKVYAGTNSRLLPVTVR